MLRRIDAPVPQTRVKEIRGVRIAYCGRERYVYTLDRRRIPIVLVQGKLHWPAADVNDAHIKIQWAYQSARSYGNPDVRFFIIRDTNTRCAYVVEELDSYETKRVAGTIRVPNGHNGAAKQFRKWKKD